MSPEQAQGKAQNPAADVYGVGALVFHLVYGRTVFEGANFVELLLQLVNVDVSVPARPDVPEALRALIERCLARDPQHRYPDGSALLEALNSVARGTVSGFAAKRLAPEHAPASAALPHAASVGRATLPELAQPATRPSASKRWVVAAAISVILVSALVVATWLLVDVRSTALPPAPHEPGVVVIPPRPVFRLSVIAWLVGSVSASWIAAYFVYRTIEKRRAPLAGSVAAVLGHAYAVDDLSKSLAVDVKQLLELCRSLDQHMLAKTLALMIGEYDKARESEDRQAALMKAVDLMEKLHEKLAPWYVKRQGLLAWGVGIIGSVMSAAKTLGELLELLYKR